MKDKERNVSDEDQSSTKDVKEIIESRTKTNNIEDLSIQVNIEQVTNNVTTVIENGSKELVEGAKELIEGAKELIEGAKIVAEGAKIVAETNNITLKVLGLDMIKESNLSDEQKIIAQDIYESLKPIIQDLISDPSVNNSIKVTKIIAQIIKKIENTPKSVNGANKKEIAIQVGRILIKEAVPDDKGEAEILMVYDLMAESTLEAMIEVSKVVNVVIQEVATKCCPGLLELFKKAKSSK
jgi:hypothetical protein